MKKTSVNIMNNLLWKDFSKFCIEEELRLGDGVEIALLRFIKNGKITIKERKYIDKQKFNQQIRRLKKRIKIAKCLNK